jgi:hypothetical protein
MGQASALNVGSPNILGLIPIAYLMNDSTFKVTLGALLVVYLLLFVSVTATP